MKEITIILFCTWKFAATFPVAIVLMKMSVAETLIFTNLGGALGTLIFVFLSDAIFKVWNIYRPKYFMHRGKKKKIFKKETESL
jgi:hypothetical protein